MKKTKKALVALLLCAAAFASCKKDRADNNDPTDLIAGTWAMESLKISNLVPPQKEQILSGPGGSAYDWHFGADGKATVVIPNFGGPLDEPDSPFFKVGSLDWHMLLEPITWAGTYTLASDAKSITVTEPGSGPWGDVTRTITVQSLRADRMTATCSFAWPLTDIVYATQQYTFRKR